MNFDISDERLDIIYWTKNVLFGGISSGPTKLKLSFLLKADMVSCFSWYRVEEHLNFLNEN